MADQLPPVLTLHRIAPGSYALRLSDPSFNSLAAAISKLVPDMASLLLITPTEMLQFHLGREGRAPVPSAPHPASLPVESAAAPAADDPGYDPTLGADALDLPPAEPVSPAPRSRKRAPAPDRKSSAETAGEPCGRCGGAGHVQVALENGGVSSGTCPVCQGNGSITRFGRRR